MTPEEPSRAVQYLEETRRAFLDATSGLSDSQWNFREADGRWSVADCAEHMALSEAFIFGSFQKNVVSSAPRPELKAAVEGKDTWMFDRVPSRVTRVQAPEHLRPARRWADPAEAVRQFLTSRDITIEFAKTTGADFRSLFAERPFLKTLDGYQWLLFLAAHSARHTAQIREVQAHAEYPKR
jgi:uncharacterized damage-inducible protein DinB